MASFGDNAPFIGVTVDDFDPLVSYSNYADWTTPDPSLNPTWYNETQEVTGSPWHQGKRQLGTEAIIRYRMDADETATYHQTSVIGTKATFNFTCGSNSTSYREPQESRLMRHSICDWHSWCWYQLHHHYRPIFR